MTRDQAASVVAVDIVIIGGGVAGLWLLNLLRNAGYSAVLVEADELGGDQTLAAQGIIHGGIKYALGGPTRASEAIAAMPGRWRACLTGTGEIDLTDITAVTERFHLFAGAGPRSAITTFFASKTLRARIERLPEKRWPAAFEGFKGVVYETDDFVIDPHDLVTSLAVRHPGALVRSRVSVGDVLRTGDHVDGIRAAGMHLQAERYIVAAGRGAGELLATLHVSDPAMQLRPLHQVVVAQPDLPALYAHCLTRITRPEPRLTVTGRPGTWYVGGQLATHGASLDAPELADLARRELAECVPWLDWHGAAVRTLRFDRAEPRQPRGERPDEASVSRIGRVLVCWPTKLTLAPDLGDKVVATLDLSPRHPQPVVDAPRPRVGQLPW